MDFVKNSQKNIDQAAKAVQKTSHKVELDHLHAMSVTGVEDVPTFTDKTIVIRLKGETLTVSGQNLSVKNLDVTEGRLQIEGQVNVLKYSSSAAPSSFAKRIFKGAFLISAQTQKRKRYALRYVLRQDSSRAFLRFYIREKRDFSSVR